MGRLLISTPYRGAIALRYASLAHRDWWASSSIRPSRATADHLRNAGMVPTANGLALIVSVLALTLGLAV